MITEIWQKWLMGIFSTIFRSRNPSTAEIEDVIGMLEARVDASINQELRQVFSADEVKCALS